MEYLTDLASTLLQSNDKSPQSRRCEQLSPEASHLIEKSIDISPLQEIVEFFPSSRKIDSLDQNSNDISNKLQLICQVTSNLTSISLRKWVIREYFVPLPDREYYLESDFTSCIETLSLDCLPSTTLLTRKQWNNVRYLLISKFGRPRRFSPSLVNSERRTLRRFQAMKTTQSTLLIGSRVLFVDMKEVLLLTGVALRVEDIKVLVAIESSLRWINTRDIFWTSSSSTRISPVILVAATQQSLPLPLLEERDVTVDKADAFLKCSEVIDKAWTKATKKAEEYLKKFLHRHVTSEQSHMTTPESMSSPGNSQVSLTHSPGPERDRKTQVIVSCLSAAMILRKPSLWPGQPLNLVVQVLAARMTFEGIPRANHVLKTLLCSFHDLLDLVHFTCRQVDE